LHFCTLLPMLDNQIAFDQAIVIQFLSRCEPPVMVACSSNLWVCISEHACGHKRTDIRFSSFYHRPSRDWKGRSRRSPRRFSHANSKEKYGDLNYCPFSTLFAGWWSWGYSRCRRQRTLFGERCSRRLCATRAGTEQFQARCPVVCPVENICMPVFADNCKDPLSRCKCWSFEKNQFGACLRTEHEQR
jgi:hypothetical protein